MDQTVTLDLPVGTGSLDVKIGKTYFADSNDFGSVRIRSEDDRWETRIYAKTGESKRFDNLPAGTWRLLEHATRQAPAVKTVELAEGEARTITLEDTDRPAPYLKGYLRVQAFLPNGAFTPCHVSLSGPDGPVPVHTQQYGEISFTGDPGTYQLTVTLRGYETIQRPVEMLPVGNNGSVPGDATIDVELKPL